MKNRANENADRPGTAGTASDPAVGAGAVAAGAVGSVEELDEAECWRLLQSTDLGRLAVAIDSGVDIFPTNYTVRDRRIFLRSAPGSKMIDITDRPSVAYEADGTADGYRWSVVVKGVARRLGLESEIEESGVLELRSESPTEKHNYLRIEPDSTTGRRFPLTRRSD